MKPDKMTFSSIDEYIATFHKNVQKLLKQLRKAIKDAAPKAEECKSYQMPAFRQNGILVYFAGYKNHVGFYPTGRGIAEFKADLADYKTSKGTVQFPLDKSLPLDLIKRIVQFRVSENSKKLIRKNSNDS